MIKFPIIITGTNIAIADNVVMRGDAIIFEAPSSVAECAVLDDRIFLVLAVNAPEKNLELAGTNLWCIDTNGQLIWKAPNLNRDDRYDSKYPHAFRTYYDLRIYDKEAPKLLLAANERGGAQLNIVTGQFPNEDPSIDWSQPYEIAWKEYLGIQKQIEAMTFIASRKFMLVAPNRFPIGNHPWPPAYITKQAALS